MVAHLYVILPAFKPRALVEEFLTAAFYELPFDCT